MKVQCSLIFTTPESFTLLDAGDLIPSSSAISPATTFDGAFIEKVPY